MDFLEMCKAEVHIIIISIDLYAAGSFTYLRTAQCQVRMNSASSNVCEGSAAGRHLHHLRQFVNVIKRRLRIRTGRLVGQVDR